MIFNFGRLMQSEMGTEGNVLDINLIKMMVKTNPGQNNLGKLKP
jgi:hypothetical protein